MLLNDTQTGQANIGLDRLRDLLARTALVPSMPDLKPTFSAGLTPYDTSEPLHVCIERADQALYRAKAAGRNRTEVTQPPEQPAGQAPSSPRKVMG